MYEKVIIHLKEAQQLQDEGKLAHTTDGQIYSVNKEGFVKCDAIGYLIHKAGITGSTVIYFKFRQYYEFDIDSSIPVPAARYTKTALDKVAHQYPTFYDFINELNDNYGYSFDQIARYLEALESGR